MQKPNNKTAKTALIIAVLITAAILCRFLGNSGILPMLFGVVRVYIYLGIFLAWGFSVRNRIIQKQVRRYLTAISALMVFWILVRSLKYNFIPAELYPNITRYLWYLYYLPMLFIPLLGVLVSLSIGKPEDYRIPKKTALPLYIPTAFLFLLVITNDLHQHVFTFPPDTPVWNDRDYGYAVGYFFVIAWLILCALTILVLMSIKCRLPGSRKRILLPCIPMVILLIYLTLYYSGVNWLRVVLGDITVFTCLMYAAALEICIDCGFIQANTHYDELFARASHISAQITDANYAVRHSSRDAVSISEENMRNAENAPVMISSEKRLHNMPIHGGHVIWTEDISEFIQIREKLENTKEELRDRNALLQYEYEREKEYKIVEEQNRLYDMLQYETQTQLDKISRLVTEYQKTDDGDLKKHILAQITVLGSYIKRKKDFVLSIDSTPMIPESRLSGALAESFRSLSLMSINGGYLVNTGKKYLSGETLALAYDFFEDTAEEALSTLRSINVRVFPIGGCLRISIFADCDCKFGALTEKYPNATVSFDDDGVQLVLPLEGGRAV